MGLASAPVPLTHLNRYFGFWENPSHQHLPAGGPPLTHPGCVPWLWLVTSLSPLASGAPWMQHLGVSHCSGVELLPLLLTAGWGGRGGQAEEPALHYPWADLGELGAGLWGEQSRNSFGAGLHSVCGTGGHDGSSVGRGTVAEWGFGVGMGEVEMWGNIERGFSTPCSGVGRHWWVQGVG